MSKKGSSGMAMAGRKVAVQMAAARAMAGVGPLPTKIRQGEAAAMPLPRKATRSNRITA